MGKRPIGRPRGTKNPNAGVKPKDPDNPLTVRLFTLVSPALAQRFHQARGERSMAEALREAIERWVEEKIEQI